MAIYEPLARNMKKFQEPNGIAVHLKGGPRDRILVGITFACCIIGLIGTGHVFYSLGWKKKGA